MVETPFTAGDIHYYLLFQPQRASTVETLLPLEIFTLIHHTSHRGSQQQKPLLPLEIFAIICHPSHKGSQQQKRLLLLGFSIIIYHSSDKWTQK